MRIIGLFAQAFEHGDLQAIEGVQVWNPQGKRTGEAAVVAQELFGLQQVEQCFAAALVFFLDHAEDDFCFIGRFAQAGIVFRQSDVGFRHHLLHIGEHGLEEWVALGVFAQGGQCVGFAFAQGFHCAAETVPSRQHEAVLHP